MSKGKNIPAELIKESVSINQVLELYMIQKSKEGAFKCPFHNDKTASARIMPKNPRLVHCFGCHKTSDVIGLYMALSGRNFTDSLKEMSETFLVVNDGNYAAFSKQREQRRIEAEKKQAESDSELAYFVALCDLKNKYKDLMKSAKLWSQIKHYSDQLEAVEYELYRLDEINARKEVEKWMTN